MTRVRSILTRRAFSAALLAGPAALAAPPLLAQTASETPAPGTPGGVSELDLALRFLLWAERATYGWGLSIVENYGKKDIMPALVFALRHTPNDEAPLIALMQKIADDPEPKSWFDWMIWQEQHPEITPHAGYAAYKAEILQSIDPNFEIFLKPEYLAPDRMKIRLEEITWGGVRKDGIPSLDKPDRIPARDASYLLDDDLVFGVAINGDIRAYPLRIMGWHEMFNEVIGGVPVALAYCTLCGSGILFETKLEGREKPLIFGSSGFLYRSNKLMFDRETHSLWNQFTGKPVVGPLVDSGIELKQRPVVITTWREWRKVNPDTTVLSLKTGHRRNYDSGVVYNRYFNSPDLMFPTVVDQSRLKQKDYVFGVRTTGAAKAWPLKAFEGGKLLNDGVGGLNLVLIGDTDGRTVRAYDRRELTFEKSDEDGRISADGKTWQVTEEALIAPDGARAPRVAGHVAYWFAWDGYLGTRSELYGG